MADPNTRSGKRTPVTLKIKFKSETLEQFIERYAVDVSQGGIFIRTKEPLAVGTQMKFEFQLRDASPLIAGEGTVVWTRENDPSRPAIAPGMGVRFDRLADGSQPVLERILADKAKQTPQRPQHETTKPPLFTDTPTKIAPVPVADSLREKSAANTRPRHDSEQTPLPKPMPFHSDADEFDERAFEEATKVRSLEELAATTAGGSDRAATVEQNTTIIPPDELALRRQQARMDSTLADPVRHDGPPDDEPAPRGQVIDRDSSPNLPSPPETKAPGRLLDASPSPRTEALVDKNKQNSDSATTKLGLEPARVETSGRMPAQSAPPPIKDTREPAFVRGGIPAEGRATPRSLPVETTRPVKRPSSAPIIIGILLGVAVVCAGVWFFVLRDNLAENPDAPKKTTPVVDKGSDNGSNAVADKGSNAVADKGSNAVPDKGSATAPDKGSAATPPVATVDTTIDASDKTAIVEIEGTDQKGPVPFKAKLEKGKAYKAHVTAAGFVALDLDVKGGENPAAAKLVAKPHLLTVTSDPPGAQILIEGQATNKVTPADVDLKAFAGKTKLKVSLRKNGYRGFDATVDLASAAESDAKVVATMPGAQLALLPRPPPPPPPPHNPNPNNGSGSDQGSGATPPNNGSNAQPDNGSAAQPPPPPPDNGSASAPPPPPPPPPAGTGGSGEPEPDFVHHQ